MKQAEEVLLGSVVPSPTTIDPSASTDMAVIAPDPDPKRIPPSVKEVAPVPPLPTASVPVISFVSANYKFCLSWDC